ncbi:MAG: hypothetical protein ABI193_10165 [Minicystis sp.]
MGTPPSEAAASSPAPTKPAELGRAREGRLLFGLALLAFLLLGLGMSERMMVFSEELMMLPTPAWRVLAKEPDASGHLRDEPACHDTPRPAYLLSAGRPTFSICVGTRNFPVMTAPQFSGLFLWPLALLQSLHHDDPFLLRKILLGLGALSIALAHRLAARFSALDPQPSAGPSLASLAAVGIAVSPCFVLISSIIQPFETLPWIWVLAALLVLRGCPELAPAGRNVNVVNNVTPSTARLAASAFFVGLSLLANVKAVFFLAPLLLLALRLGVRFDRIRRGQWACILAATLLPLVPMLLPIALDPSMSWAQGRGPDWKDRLLLNLHHPARIVDAVRDLVLLFSNFGYYLVHDRLNPVSLVVAAVVCAFVAFDTVRTLVRRRGCVVTAACGTIMLSYVAVVTLLYTEFPANYTPLHGVYGVALGCAAHRLAKLLRARVPRLAAVTLAALIFVPFAWNSVQTMRSVEEIPFVTNAHAERDLARYLVEHPEPRALPITINLLAGGVVDALTGQQVKSLQAHQWLGVCEAGEQRERTADCLYERWRALLQAEVSKSALRVIFPTNLALVRRPAGLEDVQRRQLERAAADLRLDLRLEHTFTTPGGAPAALLFWIGPPS